MSSCVKTKRSSRASPFGGRMSCNCSAWSKASKTKHVTEAYLWLYKAWSGDEFPPAVRMQAFREFMDRTIGKVKETVAIESDIDTDEVRASVVAFLREVHKN